MSKDDTINETELKIHDTVTELFDTFAENNLTAEDAVTISRMERMLAVELVERISRETARKIQRQLQNNYEV